MKLDCEHAVDGGTNWREALAAGVELGLPNLFNIEWLIDRAERGEWSGLWW